jgi:hypothetical protein
MKAVQVSFVLAISAALAAASCGGSASRPGGSASPASSAPRNPPYVPPANHDTSIVTGNYAAPQQVDVTAYPPTGAVAPGQRFELTVVVAPRPNMHVYAPGADGYNTVALTTAANQFVHSRPVVYPPSEIYEFKPLKERVPAYQKPFTLVQQMTLDGSAATRAALRDQKSLTITGRFDYQACDDGTCYNPASAPLAWTIDLK